MLLYLLQGIALALPTTLTPSPFKVFIISSALQNGFRRTVPAVFAPLITDGFIIALVMLVLTQTPNWFLDLLRLGGGLFLFYLAARLWLSLRKALPVLRPSEHAARQSLFQAVAINILNPNPYIFWGVVAGPILLQGMEESIGVGISFVVGFYGAFVVGLTLLVLAFATAGRFDARINRILLAVAALGMTLIGINQIIVSFRSIIGM